MRHSKSFILHLAWHSSTPSWLVSTFLDRCNSGAALLTGFDCLGIIMVQMQLLIQISVPHQFTTKANYISLQSRAGFHINAQG